MPSLYGIENQNKAEYQERCLSTPYRSRKIYKSIHIHHLSMHSKQFS